MFTKYRVKGQRTLDGRYEVLYLGDDTSGRPLFMSRRMWGAYLATMEKLPDNLANELDIVQGAFMKFAGGGADASAGYHDLSSCIDTRTWDIDSAQERKVIIASRSVGWAVWRRDSQHGGFDEHMHWTLLDEFKGVDGGGAEPSGPGAVFQWGSYRRGNDGLSPEHKDYHPRPHPIPVFNLKKWKDNQLPTLAEISNAVWAEKIGPEGDVDEARSKLQEASQQAANATDKVNALSAEFEEFRTRELARDKNTKERDVAVKAQLDSITAALVNIGNRLDSIDSQVS